MDIKKVLKEEYEELSKNYRLYVNLVGVAYVSGIQNDADSYVKIAKDLVIKMDYIEELFNLIGGQDEEN